MRAAGPVSKFIHSMCVALCRREFSPSHDRHHGAQIGVLEEKQGSRSVSRVVHAHSAYSSRFEEASPSLAVVTRIDDVAALDRKHEVMLPNPGRTCAQAFACLRRPVGAQFIAQRLGSTMVRREAFVLGSTRTRPPSRRRGQLPARFRPQVGPSDPSGQPWRQFTR